MWTYFDNTVILTTSAYIIIICRISMEIMNIGWQDGSQLANETRSKTIGTEGVKPQLRMYFSVYQKNNGKSNWPLNTLFLPSKKKNKKKHNEKPTPLPPQKTQTKTKTKLDHGQHRLPEQQFLIASISKHTRMLFLF